MTINVTVQYNDGAFPTISRWPYTSTIVERDKKMHEELHSSSQRPPLNVFTLPPPPTGWMRVRFRCVRIVNYQERRYDISGSKIWLSVPLFNRCGDTQTDKQPLCSLVSTGNGRTARP